MEPQRATFPGRLTVVLKNVRAVREVYDYIELGELRKDLISAQQALVRHLSQALKMPDTWKRPFLEEDGVWLHPEKKWNLPSKGTIAIVVSFPRPVPEQDLDWQPSVALWVPSWKLREQFTDSLRPIVRRAKGWEFIRDFEPGEIHPCTPMFKYIQYEEYASSTGFDTAGFFQAIAGAVGELLQLETEIDGLLKNAKAMSAASPPRQTGGQTRREPKRR